MIVNRQIPKLVYNKIQELNYKHKEHLYVICDMIIRVGSVRRNHNEYYDFIDIPRDYFRDIIKDSKYFYIALNLLKENNIIECDEKYSKDGGKALGFRFNKDYISLLVNIEMTSKSITGNIIKNRNKRLSIDKKLIKSKEYFINNFNIDYDKAKNYIDEWFYYELNNINNNYTYVGGFLDKQYDKEFKKLTIKNCYYMSQIENIRDREIYFNRNKTNDRLDTNLTNLKSELKQFITIPNLTQIDISSSQPYFLYLTIKSNIINSYLCGRFFKTTNGIEINKEELEMYGEWVSSGLFYEKFQEYLVSKNLPHKYDINISKLNRKDIKILMFKIFYSHNDLYITDKEIFKLLFPTIYNWIYEYKREQYNKLSIDMQKIESEICLDLISQELDKENINYFTIHDAWLVDNNDIPKVKEIIEHNFNKKYNNIPNLKIEKITN